MRGDGVVGRGTLSEACLGGSVRGVAGYGTGGGVGGRVGGCWWSFPPSAPRDFRLGVFRLRGAGRGGAEEAG